jgi:hypothetical protein
LAEQPVKQSRGDRVLQTATNTSPADATQAYNYYIGKHVWSDACVHSAGLVAVSDILHTTGQLTTLSSKDVPKFTDTKYCSK